MKRKNATRVIEHVIFVREIHSLDVIIFLEFYICFLLLYYVVLGINAVMVKQICQVKFQFK